MTARRFVRDFPAGSDPWPIVEAWAGGNGYRPVDGGEARTYRKGAGFMVGARRVLIGARGGWVHLEAWVAANALARLMSLFLLPSEITIEPGGMKAILPRKTGRREVNDLLARFGQSPVGEAVGAFGATPGGAWSAALPGPLAVAAGPQVPPPIPAGPPPTPLSPLPGPPASVPWQAPAWQSPASRPLPAPSGHRRGARIAIGVVLLLVVGIVAVAAAALRSSSPDVQELNAAAKPGGTYIGPRALFEAVVAGGVPCSSYTKGDNSIGPVDTVVSRQGHCTLNGEGVTMDVYAEGPLTQELIEGFVVSWLEGMEKYESTPLILVGPNWTAYATDDDILIDVQEAIGGTLREQA